MIHTDVYTYKGLSNLKQYISENIVDSEKLLIQIFFIDNNESYITSIQNLINTTLPLSHIIGATTDGSINNAQEDTFNTTISFTLFEKSTLKHTFVELEKGKETECANTVCENIISDKTKVLLLFTEGLQYNSEAILHKIDSLYPDVIIAGGLSGDNALFEKTVVCDNTHASAHGIVALAIDSDSLHVHQDYNISWHSIGRDMIVTKCEGARVYEIDNIPAIEIYNRYLGSVYFKNYDTTIIPTMGIEFPLIIQQDEMLVARAALSTHKDGSLQFAGAFEEGQVVNFSTGETQDIIKSGREVKGRLEKRPVQSIFIYSCMARRRFLGEDITQDIKPLCDIAPVSGFYTYGEFYSHNKGKEFLNHTMTVLALSEEDEITYIRSNNVNQEKFSSASETVSAIKHLLKSEKPDKYYTLSPTLEWNIHTSELIKNKIPLSLTQSETLLFELLYENKNKKISSYDIYLHVWDDATKEFSASSVRTLIKLLRKKLEENVIENIYGGFYRLKVETLSF